MDCCGGSEVESPGGGGLGDKIFSFEKTLLLLESSTAAGLGLSAFVQPKRFAKRQKASNKFVFFILKTCFIVKKLEKTGRGYNSENSIPHKPHDSLPHFCIAGMKDKCVQKNYSSYNSRRNWVILLQNIIYQK